MSQTAVGMIVKALGGFYYVKCAEDNIVECRARGKFRKDEISPLVGDRVEIELTAGDKGYVVKILERRNSLIRPPVANIDLLLLVVSSCEPAPNPLIIDKLTAIAARRNIKTAIVFTKKDLKDPEDVREIYRISGYDTFAVDSISGEGVDEVRRYTEKGLTVFCGNSGAGKSSLLNALYPQLSLSTGEISQKLGRGRHTTRHVELYETAEGGYIADTPGFSAIEFLQFEKMLSSELENCFPEFADYLGKCKFTGCSHTKEKGCAILEAVEKGEIHKSRHDSYVTIYNELKTVKEWELKK